MILKNLTTIDDKLIDVFFNEEAEKDLELRFGNAIVFPGLVNSHDHLDFNLFPQLGQKKYSNYTQWGHHIHTTCRQEIDRVLKVPADLRAQWGLYKNLFCGITTVINHGDQLEFFAPPITVYQQAQSLHSVHFEKHWKLQLNNPFKKNQACVIHCGEGIDETASREIDQLIKWNWLHRDLIAVHGVAMNSQQSSEFKAVVWCPASNFFLFGQTAQIAGFNTSILFGTDSTLTGSWNIWEQFRQVLALGLVGKRELFNMVTATAGEVWELPGYDNIEKLPADLVIARSKKKAAALDNFFELEPEDILMVIHRGRPRLFDASFCADLHNQNFDMSAFSRVSIRGVDKLVQGDVPGLMRKIKACYPEASLPVTEAKSPAEK
jgi:cytosine/adenosine deaminase-related metal-dependent hydrolase